MSRELDAVALVAEIARENAWLRVQVERLEAVNLDLQREIGILREGSPRAMDHPRTVQVDPQSGT